MDRHLSAAMTICKGELKWSRLYCENSKRRTRKHFKRLWKRAVRSYNKSLIEEELNETL